MSTHQKIVRAALAIVLLCFASLTLAGCRRSGPMPVRLPAGPAGGTGSTPGFGPRAPSGGGLTGTANPPGSGTVPWAGGSGTGITLSGIDGSGATDPGASAVVKSLPPVEPGQVDVRDGGRNLEGQAYAWAAGAVQPRTDDPTVLRHEAVHWIDGELSGNASWQDLSPSGARAFYIWGTNKYYVVPNTRVRKRDVLPFVPTHLTSSYENYFYNFDFGSRDALHLLEDFCAEIGSGEKSSLLFDMLVYSAALGLHLEQLAANGKSDYWTQRGGTIFRGTVKAFMEMAAPGLEGRLQSFAQDPSAKSRALREFLDRTYGKDWTRQVLGFQGAAS